jgi:hypothetical protein
MHYYLPTKNKIIELIFIATIQKLEFYFWICKKSRLHFFAYLKISTIDSRKISFQRSLLLVKVKNTTYDDTLFNEIFISFKKFLFTKWNKICDTIEISKDNLFELFIYPLL